MPHGMVNSNFSRPCPRCRVKPVVGDFVIKVTLPTGVDWWHQDCRDAARAELRAELESTPA